jgi:hypothetical protein
VPSIEVEIDGVKQLIPSAFMGAEGRYEDYVYLAMLEREWKRPLGDADTFLTSSHDHGPSPRAAIGIVFWAYFETRIDRLVSEAMYALPDSVREYLLSSNSTISARLKRLYRTLFRTTYWADLDMLGYRPVTEFLRDVQRRRNRFAHGEPAAIGDDAVKRIVEMLEQEHHGWIAVFNLRAARRSADLR